MNCFFYFFKKIGLFYKNSKKIFKDLLVVAIKILLIFLKLIKFLVSYPRKGQIIKDVVTRVRLSSFKIVNCFV